MYLREFFKKASWLHSYGLYPQSTAENVPGNPEWQDEEPSLWFCIFLIAPWCVCVCVGGAIQGRPDGRDLITFQEFNFLPQAWQEVSFWKQHVQSPQQWCECEVGHETVQQEARFKGIIMSSQCSIVNQVLADIFAFFIDSRA